MKNFRNIIALTVALAGSPSFAQDATNKPDDSQMMAAMMQLAQPGDNHKILATGVGSWTYKVKWWMSPDAPPMESTGTTSCKAVMGGRYFISEHTGKMSMPGADGKPAEMEFKGMGTEGYDNAKKKFVASWIDNMGTGIMLMEGTYDPATKCLTYIGDETPMPGMTMKVRQAVKIIDNDHRVIEFFEDRGGASQTKTMEITYTRS